MNVGIILAAFLFVLQVVVVNSEQIIRVGACDIYGVDLFNSNDLANELCARRGNDCQPILSPLTFPWGVSFERVKERCKSSLPDGFIWYGIQQCSTTDMWGTVYPGGSHQSCGLAYSLACICETSTAEEDEWETCE